MISVKVGDKVVVQERFHAHAAGELPSWIITKVGRKWFTAGGHEFSLEDGKSKSGYSYPTARTLEQYDEDKRVADAVRALSTIGVTIDHYRKDRRALVLEVYQELRDVIGRRTDTRS